MAKSTTNKQEVIITEDIILNKIYYIRGQKIMLDTDLAELYGVETKRLKEQVRRNINRFPPHFMMELTREEYNNVLRSHFATLKHGSHSKYLPFAFTEHGLLMLSNVLRSEQAINMSIKIIDVFVKMREMLNNNIELKLEIEQIKNIISLQNKRQDNQDKNIELVFQYLDELTERKEQPPQERKKIGYKEW
ncbi:KilA-N, DNA-binding domain protein [Pseudopedobacter saltans DSM 12145]|uniref:KilA-N, DNA-binding domain protein n=1 Tax=Pseudopedobacter saltans (strain ATCC 51119 / DSM 12145 / JCM 21818 / CCUG 39354 / LMG 10337 / NBRC 100064 / NCIMB 13643) TaxID=762903 RepID=F0SDE7_PSESL|nr:ORF6N domain-containing protein [Pseudopedobacter saltans]ADY53930.1 KilA-N, DNA-binding domain protein [Pseudopedobacter saltans DSM 12145]